MIHKFLYLFTSLLLLDGDNKETLVKLVSALCVSIININIYLLL